MSSPNDPSMAGWLDFIRTSMKINSMILPDNSYWVGLSYNLAIMIVNFNLQAIPNPDYQNYPSVYTIAVYNFAGDRLVNLAQDDPSAPNIQGTNPPLPYFANLRKQLNIEGYVSGVVTSSSDNGSSVSLQVPEWIVNATLQDLQTLKTPWGRAYMAIAQSYGPTVWAMS